MKFNNKDKTNNQKAESAVSDIASKDQKVTSAPMKDDPKPIDSVIGKDQGLDSLNAVASDMASASHKSSASSKDSSNKGNSHSDYKPRGNKNSFNHHHGKNGHEGANHSRESRPPKAVEPDANPKAPKTVEEVMGAFLGTRSDRTINDYSTPNSQQLSLLGVTQAAAGINWQIVNDITKLYYANAVGAMGNANGINAPAGNSNNITANLQNTFRATVDTINSLFYTKHPFLIGSSKLFENMFTQGFITTGQRLRELNTGILNYAYRNTDTNDYQWFRGQGQENSIYPQSSLPDNMHESLPLMPDQIDDIQLFSLDGGAFLKSTNFITPVPQDTLCRLLGYDAYTMPGIPGFNHYETREDIDAGLLTASHLDARTIVDRQYIYDGDNFTSNTGALGFFQAAGLDALPDGTDTSSIVHFAYTYDDIWNDLQQFTNREVNRQVVEENFMTYPDYNYAVIQSDFQKMFKALRAMTQVAIDDAELGQLIGITDEQAFYNAVQSAIHFGTFFRCLLYSFGYTYANGAFTKAKLGALCYNDTIMRNMSIAKFKACQQFFDCLANNLSALPYNKYSFENFKLWFNVSMSQKGKDVFDENNPVYSIRAIFCGMSNLMQFAALPHDTPAHRINNYTPTEYAATVNGNIGGLGAGIRDIFHCVENVFGYRVKTLAYQSTMFVPHGDALANFFARFPEVFTNRPWVSNHDPLNALSGSLTAILDPLNFTGFITNFIVDPQLIGQMCEWVRSYVRMVAPFYTLVKRISDNCATVHFDDAVDYTKPSFNPVTIAPDYKQHIIDYFQNTPRMMRFNLALRDTIEEDIRETIGENGTVICLSSHRPTVGFQPPRHEVMSLGANPAALEHVSTPRIGLELPKNSLYYDFGTIGTQMYNVSNPWATAARPYGDNALNLDPGDPQHPNPLTDLVNPHVAQILNQNPDSGYFLSGGDITEPFDLYQKFWYPSFWHMPYYQRQRRYITPVYDRPLQIDQHPNDTDFMDGQYAQIPVDFNIFTHINNMDRMHFFAYDFIDHQPYENPTYREYRELFQVYRHHDADVAEDIDEYLEIYPAATSIRLLYGAGNYNLVNPDQYVGPNTPGNYTRATLSTRQNIVSIFTAFNMACYGLPTSRNNIQYSAAVGGETLYREKIYDAFSKSLGIPYQPFLSLSVGASLFFDQVLAYVPTFEMRAYVSDVDLSTKYFNILANITTLQSGLYNGEAYPSMDGWGTDQITYPEKINKNEFYDKFFASAASKQVSNV